jgi:nicotinate dehydrogenase subunit A
VLIDGKPARSCYIPISAVAGREVTTLEGLTEGGAPGPVQRAFIAEQAAQCGYCLNGMIIAAEGLLRRVPAPTEAEIRNALSHNLCRCGTHVEILRAVRRAARERNGG